MTIKDNLELWKKVEKTNPKYTKNANVKGNKITSIAPQYQIMNVTEQFGIYGKTWGFKNITLDYTLSNLGLVVMNAAFFFPDGEFPIINSISLFMDNAKTKLDDNFAKKLETDALTKAISKLGFNADIFLGKFDDQRYLEEITKEFNKPLIGEKAFNQAIERLLAGDKEIEKKVKDNYQLTAQQIVEIEEVKIKFKTDNNG